MTIWCDTETFSEIPISAGVPKYIEGKLEVMLVSYAFDDGPEQVWDRTVSKSMPLDLYERLIQGTEPVVFLNAQFDRTVLRVAGIVDLPCERIIDVMVMGYCHGLPGAMEKLCAIFNLSEEDAKFKDSKALIHFFCKINSGKRNTRLTHPEKWARFREYAKRDIKTMRILYGKLPKWNYPGTNFPAQPSNEHRLWCLDQKINDRGFLADLELAECAVNATALEKADLAGQVLDATMGEVASATQRDELLKFIVEAYGVTLPDMRADTLQRRIDDPELPDALRELLVLRVASSRNASAKYKTVLQSVSNDGRLRFTAQFAGAAITGRWAHRKFQPGNMMRPTMKAAQIAQAIQAIKGNCLDLCYDNVAEVLGNCVRGVIVAPPRRKLYVADLKSIEDRAFGFLSDDPILDFFRGIDAGRIKFDSYVKTYAECFGVDPATVTKDQRQIGKPIALAFLYGGAAAAFVTFALTYHIDLDAIRASVWETGDLARLRECSKKYDWAKEHNYHAGLDRLKYAAFEYLKQVWREARPKAVAFWAALAEGFKQATLFPNKVFKAGPVSFRRDGHWLRLRLPSGRNLIFLQPKVDDRGNLSYMSHDRYTRKWCRQGTHPGKVAGIVTQAFARDILCDGMEPIEDDDFDIVLEIHDEVIAEGDEGRDIQELIRHLIRPKPWAVGLPLAADGFVTDRYRKE